MKDSVLHEITDRNHINSIKVAGNSAEVWTGYDYYQMNHCYSDFLSLISIKISATFTYQLNKQQLKALQSDGPPNTEKKSHPWGNTTFACNTWKITNTELHLVRLELQKLLQ
jgi:hypothetical protein